MWLQTMLTSFVLLEILLIASAALMQIVGRTWGDRCQKVPEDKGLFWHEFFESSRCMYMVSVMAALPLLHYRRGESTGLTWELKMPLGQYCAVFVIGMFIADFWTYLKHRLLHCRPLYAIHKHHHSFPNPSAFAGFAIHPIETLWTFAPIYLWDHLEHWLPVFISAVGAFFILNSYLHCGYTISWAEKILPRFFINTSAFHNIHHEKTNTHFGEISSLWDYLLGTAGIYDEGLQAGYQWHVDAGKGARHWRNKSQ
jgi:lathosterol oxidase